MKKENKTTKRKKKTTTAARVFTKKDKTSYTPCQGQNERKITQNAEILWANSINGIVFYRSMFTWC